MQFNCNKSQLATAEIEGRFASNQLDLALVQEPQLTDNPAMGCRVKKIPGTIAIQSSNSFRRPGARAAIYVRNDVTKAIKLIVLEQFSDRDAVVTQVELLLNDVPTKLIICSIYCPRLNVDGNSISDPTQGKFKEAVAFANNNRFPILIGTDANAHNPQWGGQKTDSRGILLEEYCQSEGYLRILNTRGTITYDRIGANAVTSSIDLTLYSESLIGHIKDWNTLTGFRGSDHKPIVMELLAKRPETGRVRIKSSTNWKKYTEIVEKNLKALGKIFSRTTSIDSLETAASIFGRVLRDAYNSTTRSRKVTCNFKREWYSKELENQRKKINRIQSKLKRAKQSGNDIQYQTTLIEFRAEKNLYSKNCSKQKYKKWRKMANDLEDIKDTARLQKILEKKASSNLGTIRRADGSYTVSIEETQEELMKFHLPGCIRLTDQSRPAADTITLSTIKEIIRESDRLWLDNLLSQQPQPRPPSVIPDEETDKEIKNMTSKDNLEWAIASFKPNKAPGPDGITPNMLKKAGRSVLRPLSLLFTSSAKLSHIPEEWSAAAVTFIPKAGKPSFDEASAYRPISLMSFVLKTMEKLVDKKIRKVDSIDTKLHKNQHAYREGKGTATALDEAATILENCLSKGGKAVAVYVDIKGAFDQTAYITTTGSLSSLGVKPWTVNWFKRLLSNRKLQPANKDSPRRYQPVMGLPQGGCSSPLGWIVSANSLVVRLTQAGFEVIAYADDFKIITKKKKGETDHLSSHTNRALRIVSEWCDEKGLSVNPDKIGVVQFYRGKVKVKNMNAITYQNSPVTPVEKFKYLGVFFDQHLHWDAHVTQAIEKGRRTAMIAAQYLRFSWGPSPKAALLLMNQVVIPRITYGCGVWWHKAQLDKHSKKLDKLQRLMMRMALGVFHTTPTADILRIIDSESLSLRIKKLALDESLRLSELGGRTLSEEHKGHRAIDLLLGQLIGPGSNGDYLQKTWNTQRRYKVIINDRENWQLDLDTYLFHEVWYSDGSKKDSSVGVGWCDQSGRTEKSLRISDHATIMQAETLGIEQCAREMLSHSTGNKLLILSDSQAALKALNNPIIRSRTIGNCAATLCALAANNDVTLGWIPGHSKHVGNEKADHLANEGADKVVIDTEIPEATSSRSNKITQWLKREREREWLKKRPDNGLFALTLIKGLRASNSKEIINKKRSQIRARFGILTGHARAGKYIARVTGDEMENCRFCDLAPENVEHLICSCPRLEHVRDDVLGLRNLNTNQLRQVNLEDLVKFSKEAGFYDLLACDFKTNN